MKDHFCPAEKEMIGFEGVCNWCGAEEKSTGWRKRQIALDKKAENARELGLDYEPVYTHELVEAYIQAAVQAEREACAKVCDNYDVEYDVCSSDTAVSIALQIRARSNT